MIAHKYPNIELNNVNDMNEIKLYTLNTKFEEGKYKGLTLEAVLKIDFQYVNDLIYEDLSFRFENSTELLLLKDKILYPFTEKALMYLQIKKGFEQLKVLKPSYAINEALNRLKELTEEDLREVFKMNRKVLNQRMSENSLSDKSENEYLDDYNFINECIVKASALSNKSETSSARLDNNIIDFLISCSRRYYKNCKLKEMLKL